MISILTTLSNFSCVISILTTLSKYTCIFESILQLLGKIFQTDTFKIFELIVFIFFAFLNVYVIGSKNNYIVLLAIAQSFLYTLIIFFYFISWWIRCASADGGDYKSKELDIFTTVSEMYVLVHAAVVLSLLECGNNIVNKQSGCEQLYTQLLIALCLSSISLAHTLLMEPMLFFRSLVMSFPICIYFYVVFRCFSLVFGVILCCCRGVCDLRWELIEGHKYQPTQLHTTCFKNTPEDNEIEVPPLL
jgi:hypothetical protein